MLISLWTHWILSSSYPFELSILSRDAVILFKSSQAEIRSPLKAHLKFCFSKIKLASSTVTFQFLDLSSALVLYLLKKLNLIEPQIPIGWLFLFEHRLHGFLLIPIACCRLLTILILPHFMQATSKVYSSFPDLVSVLPTRWTFEGICKSFAMNQSYHLTILESIAKWPI